MMGELSDGETYTSKNLIPVSKTNAREGSKKDTKCIKPSMHQAATEPNPSQISSQIWTGTGRLSGMGNDESASCCCNSSESIASGTFVGGVVVFAGIWSVSFLEEAKFPSVERTFPWGHSFPEKTKAAHKGRLKGLQSAVFKTRRRPAFRLSVRAAQRQVATP